MKKLLLHPLFIAGLVTRIFLIFVALPASVVEWYVPFLDVSVSQVNIDPWSAWLSQGGTPVAFPYGYVMWLFFAPLILLCKTFGLKLIYGYGFTLLAADLGLLLLLRKMIPDRDKLLLPIYWLSPIILVATYLLGFNDLIPVLLLTLSIFFLKNSMLQWAGVASVSAISAKLSMVIALPFFLIYLVHNRALRQLLPQFLKGFGVAFTILLLPFAFSSSGLSMLFSNPEMGKVYKLALYLGGNISIYLIPLAYIVMLYMAWRVKRLNFDLFNAMLGMAFLLVVLMTPATPGWFVWALPLLVYYQASGDRVAIALSGMFSAFYVLSCLLLIPLNLQSFGKFDASEFFHFDMQLNAHAISLIHTTVVAIGIILSIRIWRETVSRNDYFRLSRKPFVIGIAGDSGAGKDTLSDAIKGLFGAHSVTALSGDNYHLWDRQKPIWQVMTHLNPMANDLEGFANDLVALADGRSIHSRQYDHQTGRMSHPSIVKSNDFIIASGLHALYLPIIRDCYNLSIYLDTDEGLRRHLKIRQDVQQRGHTAQEVIDSFEIRESDSIRFIKSQVSHADLVLSLQPIHPRILDEVNEKHPLRLKLLVRSRHGLNEVSLTRVLVGVCGLHVDMQVSDDASEIELVIEGETSADDIALAARMLCPRVLEFLDIHPQWHDGIIGLMQLITLSHINQALMKRFI